MTSFFQLPIPPDEVARDLFLYGAAGGEGEAAQTFGGGGMPPCYLIIAAFSGEGAAMVDREAHSLAEGELLLLPCAGEASVPKGLGYSAALVGGTLADRCFGAVTQRFGGRLIPGRGNPVPGTLRRIHSSAGLGAAADGYWGSAKAYALLMELYAMLDDRGPGDAPELVEQAMKLIRTQYAYLAGVEDLAGRLAVSKHHLIRLFSESVGTPPGRMLTEIRLENARLLLESGKYNLETVADMVGFAGANYFCKVFKKAVGITPTEYAKSASHRRPAAEAEKLEQIFYL